jgi:hypothetical protein
VHSRCGEIVLKEDSHAGVVADNTRDLRVRNRAVLTCFFRFQDRLDVARCEQDADNFKSAGDGQIEYQVIPEPPDRGRSEVPQAGGC